MNSEREILQTPNTNHKIGKNSIFKVIKIETTSPQLPSKKRF